MASQQTPRLLFVHAHPDDETINNGATIAHYTARGAEVTVLTCTLGEEGEVIGDRWARLAVDEADQLGGYRIGELTAALGELGVGQPRFLGGAGRWRDSGMAGTPERRRPRFADADLDEAAGQLADVIAELRPHVVVTYDPNGGYGHPDHIQAHRVTTAAVRAAAERWAVPKFYWTVLAVSAFRAGLEALGPQDVPADWIRPPGEVPFGFTDEQITAEIDAQEHLGAKVAAMSAHATQVVVGPTGRAFSLSNKMVLPVLGAEHYVLVAGRPGPVGEHGWETDLLAGLELSGN
ncbi:MAG TPA: N-acetyl-1-D-myo-inositol-2-amino-2-deoxy-alpha-D-glucopyranoside deacetylase [Mycobacterium sp.]|nr:N-acetyl-1-D-myo-inositol-2-amino-2-deoxy-alpha-D-glucopyranoside deacetylase [Mycobacterium sp.]